MEFVAETYIPKNPWRDIPVLKIVQYHGHGSQRVKRVRCEFERHGYAGGGYVWYLRARKNHIEKIRGRKRIQILELRGNSLWGNTERTDMLRKGELPKYRMFEHIFMDFCIDTEKKLMKFL